MAKKADNTVLDALLTEARTANEVYVCDAEPVDGSNANIDAVKMNTTAGVPTFGAITGAGGPSPGLREYLNEQIDTVTLDLAGASDTATHIATRVGTTMKMVTTINGGTGTGVSTDDIVDIGAWTHTINAPV